VETPVPERIVIGNAELWLGDCREVLRKLPDCSVDSVVADPPYGLGFMGKAWDSTGVANDPAVWAECLRLLKPGGHLLAFGGTRTQHRLVCAIEDAGFEIRDQIGWAYGSGFPKSLDVSKAIDKAAGAEREVVGEFSDNGRKCRKHQNTHATWVGDATVKITAPATAPARQWAGWGTALKPAWEPICMARKPLIGTVAENVLAHGTGGVNVDGCRVGTEIVGWNGNSVGGDTWGRENCGLRGKAEARPVLGRWPANLIHDGSGEVVGLFPSGSYNKAGVFATGQGAGWSGGSNNLGRSGCATREVFGYGDTGSAARFFYCAKASKGDRGEGNRHPTVKPVSLMRYLCRLVTPPGGVVLDPFFGSGSTGKAAALEGFRVIGIELSAEYLAIAERRITEAQAQAATGESPP
jgi:site-specific DNA-methyltransferase (adenine-specific)